MKFSSLFTFTTLSTLIRVISGIVINKLIAVFSGPAGLAIYGNFMNLNGLLSISGSGSTQTAITKLISSTNIRPEKINIVANSLIIIFTLLVFISMALLIFPTQISNYIFKDPSFKFLIYFSIPLMWSTVMNLTMLAILNGLKEFKTFSIFNMLIALFPTILILIFREDMSIEMIVLSYLFSSLLITFFLFLSLLPFLKDVIKSLRFIQVSKLSLIAKFGITSLVTGLIVTLSILIFRNMIISSSAEGLQYAGLWESLFRLSTFYNLIIFSPISIYFLPKFSSENSFMTRKGKILKISKTVIAFTLFACLFSILFGDQIILFLFSNDFLQISSLIWLIILAETLRIIGSTFHLENIVKERFKLIVLIEATSYFLFLLSLYLFILNDSFSLLYASICYLLCTSTFMLLNIVTFYLFSAWSKKI